MTQCLTLITICTEYKYNILFYSHIRHILVFVRRDFDGLGYVVQICNIEIYHYLK